MYVPYSDLGCQSFLIQVLNKLHEILNTVLS